MSGMIERGVEYCDDCQLPLAEDGGHGCRSPEPTCGARVAQCYDCSLECLQRTVSLERQENASLKRCIAELEQRLGDSTSG